MRSRGVVPESALEYHARHRPAALIVQRQGEVIVERYDAAMAPDKAHPLYSGTKSFWGIAALCAQEDGILTIDERVGETFEEWNVGIKSAVTLRQLLQLTAGIPFGGLGKTVPVYERALRSDVVAQPGTRFTYGGIALQIFGAVLACKLTAQKETPHEYLRRRVLEPANVRIDAWRTLADGTHPLPTGASLRARAWLRFGEFVASNVERFADSLRGSEANPRYGLCWWLAPAGAPRDLFYASGSGGQALYVVPSENTIVVRYGEGGSFKHDAFLKRFFP